MKEWQVMIHQGLRAELQQVQRRRLLGLLELLRGRLVSKEAQDHGSDGACHQWQPNVITSTGNAIFKKHLHILIGFILKQQLQHRR